MLTIDGAYGEGGGQIIRTALTLSTITGQPIRVERIRAGRKKPGLRPQHLTAIHAAAAICKAHLKGNDLGSQTLTFSPSQVARPGEYDFDVSDAAQGGSAGSVGLILQTILLPLALAQGDSRLTLQGGTHVPWAPSISYLIHVFVPTMKRMNIFLDINLAQWGFYPAGGGEIHVKINGRQKPPRSIQLTKRGDLQDVWGTAAAMNLPAHIPQRMANRARNILLNTGTQARIEPTRLCGNGPGAGIFLFTEYKSDSGNAFAGFTAYGKRGIPAEHVAEKACQELLAHHQSNSPVDPYLADQVILPTIMAQGESRINTSQISKHLLTNIWTIQQFVSTDIKLVGTLGEIGTMTVKGIG